MILRKGETKMGKLKQLFCKHKETEEFISDWVPYHWIEDSVKVEGKPSYELREGRNIQTTCKRCGKKRSRLDFRILEQGLTDFSLFGKVNLERD
jgi:adenine-specific DNA methylase